MRHDLHFWSITKCNLNYFSIFDLKTIFSLQICSFLVNLWPEAMARSKGSFWSTYEHEDQQTIDSINFHTWIWCDFIFPVNLVSLQNAIDVWCSFIYLYLIEDGFWWHMKLIFHHVLHGICSEYSFWIHSEFSPRWTWNVPNFGLIGFERYVFSVHGSCIFLPIFHHQNDDHMGRCGGLYLWIEFLFLFLVSTKAFNWILCIHNIKSDTWNNINKETIIILNCIIYSHIESELRMQLFIYLCW